MNKKMLSISLMGQPLKEGMMLKLIKRFGILRVRHLIPLKINLEKRVALKQ